jgi:hypothetical protein
MNTGGTKFAGVVIVRKTLSYLSNTPGFCNVDIPASPRLQISKLGSDISPILESECRRTLISPWDVNTIVLMFIASASHKYKVCFCGISFRTQSLSANYAFRFSYLPALQ